MIKRAKLSLIAAVLLLWGVMPGVMGKSSVKASDDIEIEDYPAAVLHVDTVTQFYRRGVHFKTAKNLEVNLKRLEKGRVGLVNLALWTRGSSRQEPFKYTVKLIEVAEKAIEKSGDRIGLALNARQAKDLMKSGRIAAILSIEGAKSLEKDPARLKMLHERGVRAISLTWNHSNSFAGASMSKKNRSRGLTKKGNALIAEMNRLGIMIDISHASGNAVKQIIEASKYPVFASHSNAYAITRHPRNLSDDEIKLIAEKGGVIGICFHSPHLNGRRTSTIKSVVKHIKHIKDIAGVDVIALGTDYDGDIDAPKGLEHVGKLGNLKQALLDEGFSEDDVKKIFFLNFMRYFEKVVPG